MKYTYIFELYYLNIEYDFISFFINKFIEWRSLILIYFRLTRLSC